MPHFTLPISAGEGPMVNAFVGASAPRVTALQANGQAPPTVVPVRALLDTGASCSCVDPSVLTALGLSPTGTSQVITPSTGATPHAALQYDCMLAIPGAPGEPAAIFETVAVMALDLHAAQGFHVLIGRDLLARCVLIYNGQAKIFTLAY